ncbi:hypothetical protein IFR05_011229 [Cadophora sp. M221]|nr:hypothetical protein IFR05_011229 [Cadophora sp. M221]
MSLSVRGVFVLLCVFATSTLCSAQINLGEAKGYGILGRLIVTNTGPTVIDGAFGTGGTSVTGFYPPGIVNGNIVIGDATGTAFVDAMAAYTNIAAATPVVDLTGSDLGGMNLRPCTYAFSSTAQLTGTLTPNGTGSPDDEWYFQIDKALTTATSAAVVFVNGGNACRVYWAVGSAATLGTGTSFTGTIIAGAAVTFDTGASLIGRAFGMSATVTLDSNLVTVPDCSVSSSSSSITQGSSTPPVLNPTLPGVPVSSSTTHESSPPAPVNPTSPGALFSGSAVQASSTPPAVNPPTPVWTGSEGPIPCSARITCTCIFPGGVPTKDVVTVISTLTYCPHKKTCTGQTSTWTGTHGPLPCSAFSTCSCVLPDDIQTATSCPTSATCTGQTTQWRRSKGPSSCAMGVTCKWLLPNTNKTFPPEFTGASSSRGIQHASPGSGPAQTTAAVSNQGNVIPPRNSNSLNNISIPDATNSSTPLTAGAGNFGSICSFLIYAITAAVLALV